MLKNAVLQRLQLFPSSGEMVGGIYSVGSIRKSKMPPTLSPEDGNRSSFQNFVFFRIPNIRQSPKTQ
jgi:hypothetical protein